jgi:hypothetical protein
MAKLLITTQVYENYGTADNTYWKAKGSEDYVVKNFKSNARSSIAESATEAVMAFSSQIEQNNEFFKETIIDWRVVVDDYLTEFEQDQLDYEGRITYSPRELVL